MKKITLPSLPADRKYVVFGPGVWGADREFPKALANMRKMLGRAPKQYIVFETHEKVAVDDMGGFVWVPEETGWAAAAGCAMNPYREVLRVGF